VKDNTIAVTVLFDTDEYRGDHSHDRRVLREFSAAATLAEVIEQAELLKTWNGDRATITILPQVQQKEEPAL
jgi:hypothetical protein